MDKKKIIVASAIGLAAAGGACAVGVNNTYADEQTSSEETVITKSHRHGKRKLTDEEKAKLKAKLENMTEEEKAEWKANHHRKHKSSEES